jgi:hypothetical protein
MNIKQFKPFIAAVFLLFVGSTHASIFINPGISFTMVSISDVAQAGSSVNVKISISGLGQASSPSLGAYDLDLGFDAGYLAFSGAVWGDALLGNQLDLFNVGGNPSGAELVAPGIINLYELSFDSVADLNSLQADGFTLATVSFDVLKAGSSQLTLSANAFADAEGNDLAVITLSAPVTTVPLPPAMLLMLSGLLGLGLVGSNCEQQKSRRRCMS